MSKEKAIKALCGKVLNKEKYNYLTSDEANMSNEGINLQISLGLQSCKTKKDVCDLLEDIRTHERQKCLLKIALLKKKIRELPNRDDWIQKDLPIAKGVLDGGGISKFETLDLIDKCFQIQEQGNAKGREDKELVSSEIVRANSKDLTFSQDSPAQQNQEEKCEMGARQMSKEKELKIGAFSC